MTTSENASGLPIAQLGSTIKSHLGIAEKYEGKAEEHYKSAGIHLVEAKARIASGEYEGKFGMFLMRECNDLSSSRAYELIAIANGTKTQEEHRQAARARDQAYRDRRVAAPTVRRPTEKAVRATAPDTPEQAMIKQIAAACRGQPLEKLRALLEWAKAPPQAKPTAAEQETTEALDRMRKTLRDSAAAMGDAGISKDATRDIFAQFAGSL